MGKLDILAKEYMRCRPYLQMCSTSFGIIEDRLLSVVTVVVYFGAEEWDGPQSLREMYSDCSEKILKYAMDYHVNLMMPSGRSDSEIDEFQSNIREIMRYIKYSRDKKKLRSVISTD